MWVSRNRARQTLTKPHLRGVLATITDGLGFPRG